MMRFRRLSRAAVAMSVNIYMRCLPTRELSARVSERHHCCSHQDLPPDSLNVAIAGETCPDGAGTIGVACARIDIRFGIRCIDWIDTPLLSRVNVKSLVALGTLLARAKRPPSARTTRNSPADGERAALPLKARVWEPLLV